MTYQSFCHWLNLYFKHSETTLVTGTDLIEIKKNLKVALDHEEKLHIRKVRESLQN